MDPIVVRILSEMEEMGYDQKTFAEKLGISPVTITDWKTGKSKSYLKKITLIAINLGTTTEYLLNGKDSAVSDSDTMTNEEEHLISTYRQAAPELQAAVRRVLGLE